MEKKEILLLYLLQHRPFFCWLLLGCWTLVCLAREQTTKKKMGQQQHSDQQRLILYLYSLYC
jgi:hypothetical protein